MQESANCPIINLKFATVGDDQLAAMLETSERFCRDLWANDNPRWLSFLGRAGTGKTHLAREISRFYRWEMAYRLEPNQNTLKTQRLMRGGFVSWRNLASDLRDGDRRVFQDLCEDWFVVIDDIGAEYRSKSDFLTAKLDELLDARLGKWTVLTANLSLAEIGENLDVRIASRMIRGGSEVIDVGDLPDWNLRRIN